MNRRAAAEVVPVAAPVTGLRNTRVRLHRDGTLSFCGLVHGGWTGRHAAADCRAGRTHAVPAFRCSCGFWACPDADALVGAVWGLPTGLRCRVTMWGRIVEHEQGWRAERMRYDEVHLPRRCHRVGCDRAFASLHQDRVCGLVGYCVDHAPSDALPTSIVAIASDVDIVAADDVALARPPKPEEALPLLPSSMTARPRATPIGRLLRWLVAVAAAAAALAGVLTSASRDVSTNGAVAADTETHVVAPAVVPSLLVLGAFALLLVHRVLLDRAAPGAGMGPTGVVVTSLVVVAVVVLGVAHVGHLRVADIDVDHGEAPTMTLDDAGP